MRGRGATRDRLARAKDAQGSGLGEVFEASGFQISLVGARVDFPEVKDMFGEHGRGKTPDLIFTFRVKNIDERKILRYECREVTVSLGGHFQLHDDVQQSDSWHRLWSWFNSSGGLTGKEDVLPGQEATHVGLFSVPPPKTKYLTPTMDLAAFGGEGKVESKIPVAKHRQGFRSSPERQAARFRRRQAAMRA